MKHIFTTQFLPGAFVGFLAAMVVSALIIAATDGRPPAPVHDEPAPARFEDLSAAVKEFGRLAVIVQNQSHDLADLRLQQEADHRSLLLLLDLQRSGRGGAPGDVIEVRPLPWRPPVGRFTEEPSRIMTFDSPEQLPPAKEEAH